MSEIAVSCALDDGSMMTRLEEWRALLGANGVESSLIPGGVRLRLPQSSQATDQLKHLIALEESCCRWIKWTVTEATFLQVDATADQEQGVSLLRGWFVPLGDSFRRT